jgi:23S rRNA G2445 N2-methylase RlmL
MKQSHNENQHFFASCPVGLEELLADEIKSFSASEIKNVSGGVKFKTNDKEIINIIIHTRFASRIFKEIFFTKSHDIKFIYQDLERFNWQAIINNNMTFKINTLFNPPAKRVLNNSIFYSQKLKDAIADHMREKTQARPNVDIKNPDIEFLQRIEMGKGKIFFANILVDLCGTPLSSRGYRISSHDAPLRENLAAAIIKLSQWNYKDEFIDSMCGSGTFLIEAYLMKYNIPPSYLKIIDFIEVEAKPFSFINHLWFLNNSELVQFFNEQMKFQFESLKEKLTSNQDSPLLGFDNSGKSLDIAKTNIDNALLPKGAITLIKKDACQITPGTDKGVVVCNPPYGERLGELENLKKLYHEYGENLKENFKGFNAFILTSNKELRKAISLRTSKKTILNNGNIECRLLQYDLF